MIEVDKIDMERKQNMALKANKTKKEWNMVSVQIGVRYKKNVYASFF